MNLSVSDEISGSFKITASCQKNMSRKGYSKRYGQQRQTLKKYAKHNQKPQLQPVLIFFKFVHPRLRL